jgi:anti-sigma factor RsiW
MNDTDHRPETLQDLVDGRLSPEHASAVRAHVESCEQCRRDLATIERGRSFARTLRAQGEPPADLTRRVLDALDTDDLNADGSPQAGPPTRSSRPMSRRPIVWGAVAAAAVLVIAAGLWWPRTSVPAAVAHDFDAVVSGTARLEFLTSDPATLEQQFASSSARRVRVIDLAMMGYALQGGRWHVLSSRPSALYVYRTAAGDVLVCQMYEGTLAALPGTADVRVRESFRFHVYREGAVTVVFWQEGAIVCVLASREPTEEVVKLAMAKAMKPG